MFASLLARMGMSCSSPGRSSAPPGRSNVPPGRSGSPNRPHPHLPVQQRSQQLPKNNQTGSEHSCADTDELSEADSHLYVQSGSWRQRVNEHTACSSGDASRDGEYSRGGACGHYYGGSDTETVLSEMHDSNIEQNGIILPLGERRRQLEEQRAAVEQKQLRLAAVTKALGRYGGQGDGQNRRM